MEDLRTRNGSGVRAGGGGVLHSPLNVVADNDWGHPRGYLSLVAPR